MRRQNWETDGSSFRSAPPLYGSADREDVRLVRLARPPLVLGVRPESLQHDVSTFATTIDLAVLSPNEEPTGAGDVGGDPRVPYPVRHTGFAVVLGWHAAADPLLVA